LDFEGLQAWAPGIQSVCRRRPGSPHESFERRCKMRAIVPLVTIAFGVLIAEPVRPG
jgi:hypothetical protein